jgi:predicted PurR-regulated permease PerM
MESLSAAPWLRRALVGALLTGLVLLGFIVLQDFIVPAIWAGILSYTTWNIHMRMVGWCGHNRTLGALAMTLLLAALLVVPTLGIVLVLQSELASATRDIMGAISTQRTLPEFLLKLPVVGSWMADFSQRMQNDPQALRDTLQSLFNSSFGKVSAVVGDVGRNLAKLLVTVVSLFFFYRDGDELAQQVRAVLTQIVGKRADDYLTAIGQTVKGVLLSLVLCALAQGTLATIGYWLAGVPAPFAAGIATTLAALIPFATPIVWGSIVAWLFATGHSTAGALLLLWCATAVTWIDNLIRPLVIGGTAGIPFLLVIFGVLGGLGAFGLVGMFVGPVILAVLLAVWREWRTTQAPAPGAAG